MWTNYKEQERIRTENSEEKQRRKNSFGKTIEKSEKNEKSGKEFNGKGKKQGIAKFCPQITFLTDTFRAHSIRMTHKKNLWHKYMSIEQVRRLTKNARLTMHEPTIPKKTKISNRKKAAHPTFMKYSQRLIAELCEKRRKKTNNIYCTL